MTLTCEDLAALIYEYVEGELAEDRCVHVRVHLSGCPNCVVWVETYSHTVNWGKAHGRERPLPAAFAARLAAALDGHLKEADGHPA